MATSQPKKPPKKTKKPPKKTKQKKEVKP